jgi:RNA polymerase sigma-70 factor (sigma-E family)
MSPEHEREFREFVAARSAGLLRTAYFLTGGDLHDAQDLLQTALMATARHWGRIEQRDQPEAYVRRALARHQINRWRSRARRPETLMSAPPDHATGGEEEARVELRHGLLGALRALPPRQRAVVVLRHYEDLSESEVRGCSACRSAPSGAKRPRPWPSSGPHTDCRLTSTRHSHRHGRLPQAQSR